MKIKVGDYVIRSDQYCMWIDKEYKQKNGKVRCRRVAGYSTDFRALLSSFRQHKVLSSDAENLSELLSALTSAMDDMDELNRVALEKDFKRIKRAVRKK